MNNKIFFTIFALLILGSVGVTYYRIVVAKNYQIIAETSCDPSIEKCFVYECDPSAETCSENPAENITYYKIVSKNAGTISKCESTSEKLGCNEELKCMFGEKNCTYTYCDPNNLQEGERCAE